MDGQQNRSMRSRDENAISTGPRRTLHSRTKSSPSLGGLAAAGVPRGTSRGALGDISTTRGNRLLAQPARARDKPQEEKENETAGQPAQDSREVPNASLTSTTLPTTQTARPNRVISRRTTTIFRDYSTLPQVTERKVEEEIHQEEIAPRDAQLQEQEVEVGNNNTALVQPDNRQVLDPAAQRAVEGLIGLHIPETRPQEVSSNNMSLAMSALQRTRQQVQEHLTAAANHSASQVFESSSRNNSYVPITDGKCNAIELYAPEGYGLYEEQEFVTAASVQALAESNVDENWTSLLPEPSYAARLEVDNATTSVTLLRDPREVEDERWDITMVADYKDEIYTYHRDLEIRLAPCPTYMDNQTEIQWSMRSILIDWVVQVHERFQLFPETLFLTINIIDRFLSVKVVSINKLQLVGATALFVAGKYEEINGPSLKEMVFMVDGGYEEDEILKAEKFMLMMLDYELGWPGPMSFLRRISTADDYDLETRTVAKYFLELTIMDEKFIECPPSLLAAGAHCLSRMMLNKGAWSYSHVHYSGYTYQQLLPLLETLLDCLEDPRKHHSAIFDKYSDRKFHHAATFAQQEMRQGFHLWDHETNTAVDLAALARHYHAYSHQPRALPTPPYRRG